MNMTNKIYCFILILFNFTLKFTTHNKNVEQPFPLANSHFGPETFQLPQFRKTRMRRPGIYGGL